MKKLFFCLSIVVGVLLTTLSVRAKTTVKVIAIEAAMRAWQERSVAVNGGYTSWWEPNRLNLSPGDYPEDGFYGEELLNRQFCARLVENLFWEVGNGYFIDPTTATSAEPLDLFWDVEFVNFDFEFTPENHEEIFKRLVR